MSAAPSPLVEIPVTANALAAADGWYAVRELRPTADGERRWRRTRVAAWASTTGGVAALVPGGTSPSLVRADGYLVHAGDLERCTCPRPAVAERELGWCARCAGTVDR